MATPKKKVDQKVTNLTLARKGNSIEAKWKIPSRMKKESDDHHAEAVECELDFQVSKGKTSGEVWYGSPSHAIGMSYNGYDDVTIRGLNLSTSTTKSYGRSRFHPLTAGRYCTGVVANVRGINSPGEWIWDKNKQKWWWKRYDGSYPASMWEYIGGRWYLFDSAGWMRTGTVTWEGNSYNLASDGHLTSSAKKGSWLKGTGANADKWWYRHTDGTCTKNNWEYIGGQWYFFDAKGWMKTGSVKWKGTTYKFATDGHYIAPSNEIPGPRTYTELKFGKPRPPAVSWSYNKDTVAATLTVTTDEGKDNKERYDTMVKVELTRTYKVNGKKKTEKNTPLPWKDTQSTKYVKAFDLSTYTTSLQAGDYIEIKAFAYARGLAGNNPDSSKPVTATRIIGIPEMATVGEATVDKKAASGRIKIPVTCGARTDKVSLERRHGAGGSWETVSGATDNGNCKALYDSWGAVWPNGQVLGEMVYYRAFSERDNYSVYSEPAEAKCLYTAAEKEMCGATCKIVSAATNKAGNAVTVVMAWKDTAANTGWELSWADRPDAWNSSEEPSTHTGTDQDSTSALKGWKTKTFVVSGLASGTTYYFRMRRYRDFAAGGTAYSSYDSSEPTPMKTESADDDACGIADVQVSGTAATITVGIDEDSDNTGTELTWADHEDAWLSNEQPDTFNATWAKEQYGEEGWDEKQVIYLRGLEPGKTYWVKARRYLESGGNTTYTPYSPAKPFFVPSNAASGNYDVRCGLISVEPGTDGKSARVIVGWDGDHTGCEVSWSSNPDAWESSDGPSTFEFDWSDNESQSQDWSHTSTCYINGLEEGVTHYVRARSYFDGDPKAYSEYTTDIAVTPYSTPESVVLEAPVAIARGDAIECWWSIQSEMPQTEWHIHAEDGANWSMADDEGSLCHASIGPERYGDGSSIAFYVEAGCGGGLARSNTVTVLIADAPECEASCSATLTAQPASFEVITNDSGARLLATCYSDGCTLELPDGQHDQLEGDAVWTQALTPTWEGVSWNATSTYSMLSAEKTAADSAKTTAQTAFEATDEYAAMVSAKAVVDELEPGDEGWEEAQEAYLAAYDAAYATAEGIAYQDANAAAESATEALNAHQTSDTVYRTTVTMPKSDLYDGGSYRAEFRTVESVAGLASDTAVASFDVAYSHQAPDPSVGVWALTDDEEPIEGREYYTQGTEYSYLLTEDTEIDPSKTYYSYDDQTETYSVVQNPTVDDIGTYYERTSETVYTLVENPVVADMDTYWVYSGIAISTDIDGKRVLISLAPAEGSASTDVYDVYRMTPSGYELIVSGAAMNEAIEDPYAPYGKADTDYRICSRTADGDMAWSGFAYSMPVKGLRFDWGSDSLELPWNIEIRESASKDYEERKHVDGSVNGYWDRGSSFSGSYNTKVIKLRELDRVRLARMVGEHPGAIWVRDGYGKAMQCNVELSEVGIDHMSGAISLSFGFSKMKTTAQFKPVPKEGANG